MFNLIPFQAMYDKSMESETLKLIHEGKNVLFTFREEAETFAQQTGLTLIYVEGDFIEERHYHVKGYNCNIYWIA